MKQTKQPDDLIDMTHAQRMADSCALSLGLSTMYFSAYTGQISETTCAYCKCVQSCQEGYARCLRSTMQAGRLSAKLGEPYISSCHAGLVTITAPVVCDGRYQGCFVCGPVLMWEWDEIAISEFMQRTSDLPLAPESLLVASRLLRTLSGPEVSAVADILYALSLSVARSGYEVLQKRRDLSAQQSKLAELILETKRTEEAITHLEKKASMPYPLHKERELLGKVRLGDRTGAKAILNELLGAIFYRTAGNVEIIKARSLELVVVISRAAVEGGAGLEKLLGLNYNFIDELAQLSLFEDICQWLVKVLDIFMDTVFETRNIKNARFLGDALAFMRKEFAQNITLEQVAREAFISPFYLSHLFKEELGITFIEYLTRVRMEEARNLLSNSSLSVQEVALAVGYDDPSYFSKVFKKVEGTTPHRYRKGV